MDWSRRYTTIDVWSRIRRDHPEMVVFSSYSAPDGDYYGDPSRAKMITEYGFEGAGAPVIGAETAWDVDRENLAKKENLEEYFWLCVVTPE